jgi:hypothetical protein
VRDNVFLDERNGSNYAWERVRYLTRTLADHSMRRKTYAFQPGDIAGCRGSIERAFARHLKDLDIPLEAWEGDKPFKQPLRFCVVNRRFEGGLYEVFLMTTFGQARTFDELGPLAHQYGIPVGGMNWFENINPIRTYPASFGWEGKSFIFAIPTLTKEVIPAALRWTVRLVPGELERLRNISDDKMKVGLRISVSVRNLILSQNTYRVHRAIRRSLKHGHYKSGFSSSVDDEQDDFMPAVEEDDVIEVEHEDLPLPILVPKRALKEKRRPLPVRHDLSCLLFHSSKRIYNYSTYLDYRGIHRRGPIQLLQPIVGDPAKQQHFYPLPKPYYSPYLRVNIRTFLRILP